MFILSFKHLILKPHRVTLGMYGVSSEISRRFLKMAYVICTLAVSG